MKLDLLDAHILHIGINNVIEQCMLFFVNIHWKIKFLECCLIAKTLTSQKIQLYIIVIKYVIIIMKNSKTKEKDVNYVQIFRTWNLYLSMSNFAILKLGNRS